MHPARSSARASMSRSAAGRAGRDHEDVRADLHPAAEETDRLFDGGRGQRAAWQQPGRLHRAGGEAGRRGAVGAAPAAEHDGAQHSHEAQSAESAHYRSNPSRFGIGMSRDGSTASPPAADDGVSGSAASTRVVSNSGCASNASSFSISTLAPNRWNVARAAWATSRASAN